MYTYVTDLYKKWEVQGATNAELFILLEGLAEMSTEVALALKYRVQGLEETLTNFVKVED